MKTIKLTRGKEAIIDDCDFELVSKYNWHSHQNRYAANKGRKLGNIMMHRLIMNPPDGMVVDHINGNGLDNRRSNLRVCTQAQNMINTKRRKDNVSGLRGVWWDKARKKWSSMIKCGSQRICLGRFSSKEAAAFRYDLKARALFGSFAKTNYKWEKTA